MYWRLAKLLLWKGRSGGPIKVMLPNLWAKMLLLTLLLWIGLDERNGYQEHLNILCVMDTELVPDSFIGMIENFYVANTCDWPLV